VDKLLILIITGFLIIAACGENQPYEDYEIEKQQDLVLDQTNHPHGFGRRECFYCHIPRNIHQRGKIDRHSAAMARYLVKKDGIKNCKVCHGNNGNI